MTASHPFPLARQPIQIAGHTVRNRIVRESHGSNMNTLDGYPTEDWIVYQETRARGGVGLSIIELGPVHDSGASGLPYGWLRLHDDAIVPHLRQLTERVHRHGMTVFQQIWHGGCNAPSQGDGPAWGVSALPEPASGRTPLPMTQAMIDELVEAFGATARRCEEAGYDGVEIHGAHSYLVHQFLSPAYNRRTDAYGGSLENRMRFACEALAACRDAVSPGFAVGMRLSGTDCVDGGMEPDEVAQVARELERRGLVDFLSLSISTYHTGHTLVGAMQHPHGYELPTSRPVTRAVSVPTIVTGRIVTLAEAERVIADGDADMVSMVRATLADPELVNKSFAGRAARVRPCIGCNQGCIGQISVGQHMGCLVNPEGARETRFPAIARAARPRTVVVVGGGPAGLEAAWTAAQSGHRVTLLEAEPFLGGQVHWARAAVRRDDLGTIVDWLAAELDLLGVDVRLGRRVTAADVRALDPDAVIVATGSTPRRDGVQRHEPFLAVEGIDLPHVLTPIDVLSRRATPGRRVVVFDDRGDMPALSVAETLLEAGAEVTFATSLAMVSPGLVPSMQIDGYVRRLLPNPRFSALTYQSLVRITPAAVGLKGRFSDAGAVVEVPADTVVVVNGALSARDLFDELVGGGPDVQVVGDALHVADLQNAIRTGRSAAIAVDARATRAAGAVA